MNLEEIDKIMSDLEKKIIKTNEELKSQKSLYNQYQKKLSKIASDELSKLGTGKARKNGINPYLFYKVVREPERVTIQSLKKIKNILLNIK